MAMGDLYSPTVAAFFEKAPRAGTLDIPEDQMVRGRSGDPRMGIVVDFQFEVREGAILDGRYRVFGCPHAIAAAGWVTDNLIGGPCVGFENLGVREIADAVDLPVEKAHITLVIEDALRLCGAQVKNSD